MTKVIFLDRDGVINKEVGYFHEIDKFIFIDKVFETLQYCQKKGFKFIVITNQSGIGRKKYSLKEFDNLNDWMLSEFRNRGINILDVFFCPHIPDDNCSCRKPKPGLFIKAINKYDICLEESWMIGDSERDITAAKLAGIDNTVIVRSGHQIDESLTNARYICDSIKDIKKIIGNNSYTI